MVQVLDAGETLPNVGEAAPNVRFMLNGSQQDLQALRGQAECFRYERGVQCKRWCGRVVR